MSTSIDNKVVEMRFDNKQFESATAQSMSTLDKLKQKLNFGNSVKSLDGLNKAAKNVNISGLSSAADTVSARFSAMQVMGVTALANITNSAVNAGKRMVAALTIDPVRTGFQEYELKMGSIQTIMASTGESLETVNKYLNELNEYSDKTIYSFQDMTSNIGKFTNAGVKLEDAVLAMKGISNEAALSGANANEASRAMYNFSQALSSGYVKLIDWKSIELANMATVGFKEQLIQSAVAAGTLTKAGDGLYKTLAGNTLSATKNFNETLTDQWMTSEVLINTLKDYADETTDIGKKATQAATEVKTFTQMMDALKESAQSGWAKTWEIIFGDFYEGKTLWTGINNVVGGLLDKMSDLRNEFLESALGMGFDKLQKTVSKALGPIEKVVDGAGKVGESIENVTGTLEDLDTMVKKVIHGDFGNGEERFNKLTKSGYNYYKIQNKVNESLGDGYRYTKEQIEAQDKLLAKQDKKIKQTDKEEQATGKLTKAQKEQLKKMAAMTEEQALANGVTKEQVKALRDLNEVAEQLGMPLDELIDNLDQINGRWLLLNSFKNLGESLGKVFGALGDAFKEVFGTLKPESLFDAIAAWHRLTEAMVISDSTAEKLQSVFEGLFAAVDIVSRLVGGGLKIALTVVGAILNAFGITALDAAAGIGELVYKFDEWLKKHDYIAKAVEYLADKLPPLVENIKEFVQELYIDSGAAENFQKIADGIQSIWSVLHGKLYYSLTNILKIFGAVLQLFGTNLGELLGFIATYVSKAAEWIAENTLLINGIDKIANIIVLLIDGIGRLVKAFVKLEPVQKLIENIKDTFSKLGEVINLDFDFDGSGLDSLYNAISTAFTKIEKWINSLDESETFQAGLDIIAGLANGISAGVGKAIEAIQNIAQRIIDAFCNILGIHSPSVVFIALGGFIISGLLLGLKGGASAIFDFFGSVGSTILTMITELFQKGLPVIWDMVKNIGSQLAASTENLDLDFGALFTAGTLVGLLFLIKQFLDIADKVVSPLGAMKDAFGGLKDLFVDMGKWFNAKVWEVRANAMFLIAKAIALLAASLVVLSMVDQKSLWSSVGALAAVSVVLGLLTFLTGKVTNLKDFGKLSLMFISLSTSLLIMSLAMKALAGIDAEGAKTAMVLMSGLLVGMIGLIAAFGIFVKGDVSKNISKVGTMFIRLAIAIGLLTVVMKLIATMSWSDIGKGAAVIAGAMALCAGFVALSKFSGQFSGRVGSMFVKMAIAIGALVLVIKLIAGISNADLTRGLLVIAGIEIMFAALMFVSQFAGKYSGRAGAMFIMMAGAIAILVQCIKTIADIPDDAIVKGLAVIAAIEAMFGKIMVLSAFVGKHAARAGAMFIMMAGAIAILTLTIKVLSGISEESLKRGFAVVAVFEVLFAAMMVLSQYAGANADKAGSMMIKMSAAILILVGAIALLSLLKPKDVLVGVTAVGLLLTLFAGVMLMSQYVQASMKTLTVLTVAIGILVGSLVALSFMDPENVLKASLAISAILGMLALVLAASSLAKGSIGTLVVITLAIGMIGGVLYLLSGLPVENTLGVAAAISILLLSLSASLALIGLIGPMATSGIPALGAMIVAVGLLALIFVALEKLDVAPSIEVATSLSILLLAMSAACLILAAVGATGPAALIGAAILDGVIIAVGGLMVGIGALMKYVPEMEDFLDRGITVLEKIGYGLGSFLGNLVGGLSAGLTSGLPKVGEDLGAFMTNAKPFLDGIKTIDEGVANSVKALADAILTLTATDMLDGLTSWFSGESSLAEFGKELAAFGPYIKQYSDSVAGIDIEAIKASSGAAKALVEVANSIPNAGGMASWFAGENDMSSFGEQLVPFGKAMKEYGDAVVGLNAEAINASVTAANGINQVANAIPNSGGMGSWFTGDNDIATFGAKLVSFGSYMKMYADSVVGLNTESITNSLTAAKAIVAVADTIPKSGGLAGLFSGDGGLGSFGKKLVSFGQSMKAYSDSVAGISITAINNSVDAANKLVKMINGMAKINTNGVELFRSSVNTLAKTNISGISKTFASSSSTFTSAGTNMVNALVKGVNAKQGSVNNAGTIVVNTMVKAVSSKSSVMSDAGGKLMLAISNGMKSKNSVVMSSVTTCMTSCTTLIRGYNDNFYNAGAYVAQGLASGMKSKNAQIQAAASAMAAAAEKATRARLQINSPSKLFIPIGAGIPEGLIVGIKSLGGAIKNAVTGMGTTAIDGTKRVMSRIADVVDSDIETQPTIRPVLDLSDVRSGAGAINGMFGTPSVGVMSNLNAINSMMNQRIQNGTNIDVVSAINKLRKDLGNIGGPSYVINGVTYDDGSAIQSAFGEVIRQAKIERRT